MRVNREIRALQVRLIGANGDQIGIVPIARALAQAEEENLDLVELSSNAEPPVCKLIDYGKYRYQLTKKEREQKKTHRQSKLKEIKCRPNIGSHDLEIKIKHAREFIAQGSKVRLVCTFRGPELRNPEVGEKILERFVEALSDLAQVETSPKQQGRSLSLVLAPLGKKQN